MGEITGGLNDVFGQVRIDAHNQSQGMALFHEQLVDVHRKLGISEKEATRLHQGEIGGLKERCRKIEQESVRTDRKWQNVHEQLQKIPELERELRASNQKIAALERKLTERDNFPVDTDHASHQQIIQAQAQHLQRLTAEQEAFKVAMQALSEANVRLNESMLAQERESETRKARLEVLERVIGEKQNDALLRVPAETQNLNERLTRIEEWGSQTQMDGRTIASMEDNHQEWQTQVEGKGTDLTNQQLKERKFNELLEANSRESHSRNERLEDRLRKLENQLETQRTDSQIGGHSQNDKGGIEYA